LSELGPTLETSRLILRPPTADDFEPWAAAEGDAETMRYLGGARNRFLAWRGFMAVAGSWAINGYSMFSVIEKASGRWVGRLGPWRPEGWPGTEVGWAILRDAWGRGYATEGATAAMDWVVDHLGWTEVVHSIDPANAASQAVARRLGSSILRRQRLPAPLDREELDIWGQTAQAWREGRSRHS
jgi:RimJ/RimL family protein N-acetyltransferase